MAKRLLWLGLLFFIVGCVVTPTLSIPSPWNFAGEHSLTPPLETVLLLGRISIVLGVILLIAAFVALVMRDRTKSTAARHQSGLYTRDDRTIQKLTGTSQRINFLFRELRLYDSENRLIGVIQAWVLRIKRQIVTRFADDTRISTPRLVRNAPPLLTPKHTEKRNRKVGITVSIVALLVISAILILVLKNILQPPIHLTLSKSSHGSATFDVQATQDWQDSGVSIHPGNQVTIQYVSGLWTSDPTVSPFDAKGRPDGYTCANYEPASQCAEVVPDAVQGSLVGKIGTETLKIGNALTFTATQAGSLLLRINDGTGTALNDNQGSITVQITVS
jgi:hypothetical protein